MKNCQNNRWKQAALILSGLCFFSANGQEPDTLMRQLDLAPVTVNALGIPASLHDFSGMVSAVDSVALALSDPTLVAFELNRMAGVLMQSGTLTTNRIVIRGIGSRSPFGTNKIRAYLGEIPLTDGRGETTIEDIDLNFLGSLEVQKGPNSSLFGSGLGGVMLLHNRDVEASEMSATVGSFGLFRVGAAAGLGKAASGGSLQLQHQQAEGWRQNNATNRTSLMGTWQWLSDMRDVQWMSLIIHQKAFIPSSVGITAFNENPSAAATTWFQSAGYEEYTRGFQGVSVAQKIRENLTYYGSATFLWKTNHEPRPFNILQDRQLGGSTRSRVAFDGDVVRLQAGFELYADAFTWRTFENLYQTSTQRGSIQGDLLSDNLDARTFLNTFIQSRFVLTQGTSLEVGLNRNATVQYFQDVLQDVPKQTKRFEAVYSPRIGVVQALSDEVNLFANVSHGFSPPSVEESLNEDQTFNARIRPETGWNYELGIKGDHSLVTYGLSVYTMRVTDLLVTRRTAEDVTFGLNAGSTNHTGVEAEMRGLLYATGQAKLVASWAYTFNAFEFDRFINDGTDFSGNQLTGVPRHQAAASLDGQLRAWTAGLYTQFVDKIPITDDNTVYASSYFLMHLSQGRQFSLGAKCTLQVAYRMNNLLDTHYASMLAVNAQGFGGVEPRYYYPSAPRNHQVTVVIR